MSDRFEADARAFRRTFPEPVPRPGNGRTILVLDRNSTGFIRYEIYLYRVLQAHGFDLVCVGWRNAEVARYYDLLGIPFHFWDEFTPHVEEADAHALIGAASSMEEIRILEMRGVRLGVHALAECMRAAYLGGKRQTVADLSKVPADIERFVARGMQAIHAATTILDRFRPESVLFGDALYTLQGTFLDVALQRGIGAIKIAPALEDDTLYLKRFTSENRDWPYTSVSDSTWRRMLAATWDDSWSASLRDRQRRAYRNGGWYSLQALTRNTRSVGPEELRRALGLGEGRPCALVVPHLVWDKPVYGRNLFAEHGAWLAAIALAVTRNPRLDWIIKLHPANAFARRNEDFRTSHEFAEVAIVRSACGDLAPHVRLLMPETSFDTHSLLGIANYCLTETGTTGIEAAAMGKPVVTGGDAFYSRRGFTIDPDTPEELVARILGLHEVAPLSRQAQALAERFAYASFHLKSLRLISLALRFRDATNAAMEVSPRVDDARRFSQAPDMRAFVDWLTSSDDEDYLSEELLPPPAFGS